MPQPKRFTDEELRANKNARSRQRYIENKERLAAEASARHREKAADPEYMRKQAERAAAYRAANPHKTKEQNARRRAANPERARAESRAWFAANKHKRAAYEQNQRARKRGLGGNLSPDIRATLMKAQRGRCACCKVDLAKWAVHLDHIMPLALGGEHRDENMQLLCQPCNQSKHAKHPVDFMQELGFLL